MAKKPSQKKNDKRNDSRKFKWKENCCYKWLIEKGNLKWCFMFFVTVLTLIIVWNQRKSPDLYLKLKRVNEEGREFCLILKNKGDKSASGVELTIIIPKNTGIWELDKSTLAEWQKNNDSEIILNYGDIIIEPEYISNQEYLIEFKIKNIQKKVLKETDKSLEYFIKCNEKLFRKKGKIPIRKTFML
jgi:hypothetical protein